MTDTAYFLRLALLLVLQVLLLNFFPFSQYLVLSFLPAAILCVPARHGGVFALAVAFVAGFLTDFFADGMLGLTVCALLPVAYARTWILRLIFGADFFDREEDLSLRRNGFWPVLLAVFLATLLFFLIYVQADGAGTRPLWFNLLRTLLSTLVSTFLSLFTVNLFSPERQ
ncbi:MAG: hypothetical protein II537_05230 [Bacteroidales bacterium]|nr:hypothetical protein [Bacteroidales bacterium]